jgi:hypothetical protein
VASQDGKHPLQLTFEGREGEGCDVAGQDRKHPLQLTFEAREGVGVVDTNNEVNIMFVK